MRSAERGRRLPARAQADPRVHRRQRRQHGGGQPARRRERQRAPPRRDGARHEDRGQEHELVLRRGARARGGVRAPGAACSTRGGAVEQQTMLWDGATRRGAPEPHEGGQSRLPLLPRARPAAARARAEWIATDARTTCRSCPPRGARASPREYALGEYDIEVLTASPRARRLLRGRRARARRCQGGGQLGDGRGARAAQAAGGDARRRSACGPPISRSCSISCATAS